MSRSRIVKSALHQHSTIPYHVVPMQTPIPTDVATSERSSCNIGATDGFPARVQKVFLACERSAQQRLEAAQHEANAIRSSAISERERVLRLAHQQGERAGMALATKTILDATTAQRAQAVATARAEADTKYAHYTELLQAILAQRSSIISSAESELVALAIGIAEQILDEQPRIDKTYIVRLARRALERLAATDKTRLRCSPKEYAVLVTHQAEFGYDHSQLEFISDPSLPDGSVILDTDDGRRIDASLHSQLRTVKAVLLGKNVAEHAEPLQLAS